MLMRKKPFWRRILSLLCLVTIFFTGCGRNFGEDGALQDENVLLEKTTGGDVVFREESALREDNALRTAQVIITLLDTGVSADAIRSDNLLAGYNYVTDSTDTEDLINHGTAVASVILGCESAGVEGAALSACVVPLVVVTKQEGKITGVSPEILAKAIRDSVDIYSADIINVSLGVRMDAPALKAAVEYAEEKGVLIVSAVGNDGPGAEPWYPAAYDTVLAVGSSDGAGNPSAFSQDGADILAPGENIELASRNGRAYRARGTSYAAGFVSAEAANLLMEEPGLTAEELRESIVTVHRPRRDSRAAFYRLNFMHI